MIKFFVSNSIRRSYPLVKRMIDVCLSATLLAILLPVFIVVAIIVKLTSKGPVFFHSSRRGLHGEVFRMPKFRTMTTCSKLMSRELATDNDICLTPAGKFLRKSSLDELPQLWSVLRGDMSLVGPRPLIVNDYAADLRGGNPIVYSVRPGITGLAQINGRSFISPVNKTRYDAFYASRFCMILDIKILARTIFTVLDTKMVK